MLMSGITEDMSRNDHNLDKMSEKEVEGMIVFPSENIAAKTMEELQDKGIPFVFVDQILTGIEADQVHVDNVKGSVVLMNHLYELGHGGSRLCIISNCSACGSVFAAAGCRCLNMGFR